MLLNPDFEESLRKYKESLEKCRNLVEPDNPLRDKDPKDCLPLLHEGRIRRFKNSSYLGRLTDAMLCISTETFDNRLNSELRGPRVYDSMLRRHQAEIDELRQRTAELGQKLAELTQQEDRQAPAIEDESDTWEKIDGDELRKRMQEHMTNLASPYFAKTPRECLKIFNEQRLARSDNPAVQEEIWNASEYIAMETLALLQEGKRDYLVYDMILSRQLVEIEERRRFLDNLEERLAELTRARKEKPEDEAESSRNMRGRNDAEQ